jgi:hypothetical protein
MDVKIDQFRQLQLERRRQREKSKASMGFISQYFDDKNYSKWRLKELIIKFGNQRFQLKLT